MKKLSPFLAVIATLSGIAGAFAFNSPGKKFFTNVIYAKLIGPGPKFSYTTVRPPLPWVCVGVQYACSFTTTQSVGHFNTFHDTSFPSTIEVRYITADKIYQM
jgi:hypothetical protein